MLAGKNHRAGRHLIEVDPAQLTEGERKWLAECGGWSRDNARNKGGECDLCLDPPINWGGIHATDVLGTLTEPTVDELRRAIGDAHARQRENAARQAEADRKETEDLERSLQAIADSDPADLLCDNEYRKLYIDKGYAGCEVAVKSYPRGSAAESSPLWPAAQAKIAEAELLAAERNKAIHAEHQRLQAEHEASIARAEAERIAWIESHGSRRLKRLASEKIEHAAVYRDERLALERPDWQWESRVSGKTSEPRNPPESAFGLLDEARKIDPEAVLQHYVADAEVDEYGEKISPKVRGYVAESEFLGAVIVYGVNRLAGVEA